MSLINTLHMAKGKERFARARNAPITDGSHCCPIVPFCAHPPVFVGNSPSSSAQQFVADEIGPFTFGIKWEASEFCLRNTVCDTSTTVKFTVCISVFVWRLPPWTDVKACNKLLMWLMSPCSRKVKEPACWQLKNICQWNIWQKIEMCLKIYHFHGWQNRMFAINFCLSSLICSPAVLILDKYVWHTH